jgi:hypothetical protein
MFQVVRIHESVILQPGLLVIPPGEPYVDRMVAVSQISLAVEVVSPGSERHDRGTKRAVYQFRYSSSTL